MLINGIGNLLPPISSLLIAPILALNLGVVGRGELAAATAPYLLAVSIATLGLPESVTQAVARFPGLSRRILLSTSWIILLSGIMASALLWALAPLLSGGEAQLAEMIALAGAATGPTLLVALLRGAASGLNAWRTVAFERILSGVLRFVGIAGLASVGLLTPYTAALCLAISPVASGVAYFALRHQTDVSDDQLADAPNIRRQELLWYGVRVWFGSISGILLLRIDQAIMAPLSNAYQLGLYAIAVNVSEVPLIVNSAVREVMFASDSAENDNNRLLAAARISNLLCTVIGLVIASTLTLWVPVVFGSEFLPAIPTMLILIAAVVAGTPGSIAGAALSARGAPELRSISLTVACILNILVLILLAPWLGAVGAAIATLLGNFVASHGNIIFFQRRHGVRWISFYGIRRSDFGLIAQTFRAMARRNSSSPVR
ncbi:O-antigen/teichoic acid export membrane protein [Paenarthrobacter nicotinovorans]|uniref:oligosaccharide flippase family protein n=1 Tax=Paenarthrobacter nicotinovorans TaxID=29320 RepID=UPI00277F770E|nr:polysaccharide biosynthesis C-terminal domain-containing protein [Paenarthrobacter nicotinovorans]MDP9936322.1 O-antigen/teichoic acid export membrane protein [Paenarthrobacter nicotinovorans]